MKKEINPAVVGVVIVLAVVVIAVIGYRMFGGDSPNGRRLEGDYKFLPGGARKHPAPPAAR